jgi:hypothetical protein
MYTVYISYIYFINIYNLNQAEIFRIQQKIAGKGFVRPITCNDVLNTSPFLTYKLGGEGDRNRIE